MTNLSLTACRERATGPAANSVQRAKELRGQWLRGLISALFRPNQAA